MAVARMEYKANSAAFGAIVYSNTGEDFERRKRVHRTIQNYSLALDRKRRKTLREKT